MNHPTLRTLVREDGADSEPALTLSAHEVLRAGRRSVRRRRAVAGLAGLATAAVVAATVVVVPGLSRDGSAPRLDAASRAALREYDATLMPALVDETVRQATRDAAPPFEHGTVVAEDDQGQRLAQDDLRRTSMWVGSYEWDSDHLLRVALLHSRSESEGDPDASCRSDLEAGYAATCTAERDDQGRPVITSVTSLRRSAGFGASPEPSWMVVVHPERGNPDRLWWQRSVEVRRGGVYLTNVSETVHAPDLASAEKAWHLDTATLRTIASAPALVFPPPSE